MSLAATLNKDFKVCINVIIMKTIWEQEKRESLKWESQKRWELQNREIRQKRDWRRKIIKLPKLCQKFLKTLWIFTLRYNWPSRSVCRSWIWNTRFKTEQKESMIIFLFSQGVGSTFHLKRRLLTDHPSFWFLSSDITRNSFSSGQKERNKSFSIKRKNICSSVSVSKVLKAVKYKYEEEMICKINIGSGCDLNWWGKLWATYGFVIIEWQALAFEHCCNSHLERDDDDDDVDDDGDDHHHHH